MLSTDFEEHICQRDSTIQKSGKSPGTGNQDSCKRSVIEKVNAHKPEIRRI